MQLPDKRLSRVLDKITDRISEKQTLSLRKLSNERKEEIQFGRFIANQRVSMQVLEAQLYEQTRAHCESSHCLLIEDTSKIGFSLDRVTQGLGKIDKGLIQGFYIHPVLCVDAIHYGCYGIASIEFINRPWCEQVLSRQAMKVAKSKIAFEEKEAYRWLSSIVKALPQCIHVATKTVVADREADIYPLLTGLAELGVEYVIRSHFDRPTQSGESILKEAEAWPPQGCYQVDVPATDKHSAHKASMVIKYGQVGMKKSTSKTIKQLPKYHPTYVVEVKELTESVVNNESDRRSGSYPLGAVNITCG